MCKDILRQYNRRNPTYRALLCLYHKTVAPTGHGRLAGVTTEAHRSWECGKRGAFPPQRAQLHVLIATVTVVPSEGLVVLAPMYTVLAS